MRIEDAVYQPPERMGGVRHTHPPGTGKNRCLRLDDDVAVRPEGDRESKSDEQHDDTPVKDDTPEGRTR